MKAGAEAIDNIMADIEAMTASQGKVSGSMNADNFGLRSDNVSAGGLGGEKVRSDIEKYQPAGGGGAAFWILGGGTIGVVVLFYLRFCKKKRS
jgi:hypothetical protein